LRESTLRLEVKTMNILQHIAKDNVVLTIGKATTIHAEKDSEEFVTLYLQERPGGDLVYLPLTVKEAQAIIEQLQEALK
jgi:hypothetical protein